MPRGPQNQWRPRGAGPCAVHVAKIAVGILDDSTKPPTYPQHEPATGVPPGTLVVRNGLDITPGRALRENPVPRRRSFLMTAARRQQLADQGKDPLSPGDTR